MANDGPVNWLLIWIGEPVRGSSSVNDTLASNAETTQVASSRIRNRTAGSGSLFPTVSIQFSARATRPLGAGGLP